MMPTPEQMWAAIELAEMDYLFFFKDRESGEIIPSLLMNDTFYYACSDGEDIRWSEIPPLLEKVKIEGWPAAVEWAMERRNMQPIPPVMESINLVNTLRAENERLLERVKLLESEYETPDA